MAVENKRMQQRHGSYSAFVADKGKYIPGEFQVVQSGDPNSGTGKGLYIAMDSSNCEQLATFENVKKVVDDSAEDIKNDYLSAINKATSDANTAAGKANTAASEANTATQEAVNATEDARSVIEQITKDSYLHTALESFINEVTAKPTSYGNALVEKIEGYIRQNQPKGYQLFDASKIANKTQGGATVTNNGDGSFTISGSGTTGSTFAISYGLSHEETIKVLKTGSIYLKQNGNTTPYALVQLVKTDNANTWFVLNKINNQVDITEEMLNDEDSKLYYYIYCGGAEEVYGGTIKPMLYQDGDGTWEPYTGVEPAPSPDYPQVIHGVGDMGFFDGEFEDGAYNASTGNPETGKNYVRSVNDILFPLKNGDKIKFIYEKPVNIGILLYDKDGKMTYSSSSKYSEWEYSVTKDQERFRFFILDNDGVNAQSVKHLTVTINGMYAICVKSVGKNLCSGIKMGAWLYNSGKYSADRYYFCCENLIPVKPNTTYIVKNFSSALECNGFCFYTKDRQYISADGDGLVKTTTPENCYFLTFNLWNREETYTLIDVQNVQLEEGESPTDYIPHQGNTTYIPISYPLFAGDYLFKRNMERKSYRKMGFAVFDGSEDEVWKQGATIDGKGRLYIILPVIVKDENLKCNSYRHGTASESWNNIGNTIYVDNNDNSLVFNDTRYDQSGLSTWKDWLKEKPIVVAYELATPIEEELSPEAQKAIHSIMACDEQTTIEIVGVPTDAEVQNQFLLPRNVDGALNTTAYATSKRNEVTLAEQAQQLSQVVTQAITLAKAQEV